MVGLVTFFIKEPVVSKQSRCPSALVEIAAKCVADKIYTIQTGIEVRPRAWRSGVRTPVRRYFLCTKKALYKKGKGKKFHLFRNRPDLPCAQRGLSFSGY